MTFVAATNGGLTQDFINTTLQKAKALGIGDIEQDWLDRGRACDIILPDMQECFVEKLRQSFHATIGTDVFVQFGGANRRKKLFVADMDATMVEGETLDDMSAAMNLKDKIAPITASAMRGEIDFKQALAMRIALLKGMPLSAVMHAVEEVKPSKGAATLLKTLKRHQVRCVLVSGGFDIFTSHVSAKLGFDRDVSNRLDIQEGVLSGHIHLPVVDRDTKKKVLEEECKTLLISPEMSVAIGDGANDIPMLQAAGSGIGYFAKPLVQASVPHHIRYTDLTTVLYMQGYRKEEIAFQPD